MGFFLDLFHGREEERFSSALAVLLWLEAEGSGQPLLRRMLTAAAGRRVGTKAMPMPKVTANTDLKIRDVRCREPCEGRRDRGRFDLTIRLDVGGLPTLLVIEVKVAAEGEHGRQFRTYREHLEAIREDFPNCYLCLLVRGEPAEFLEGLRAEDRACISHVWTWRDVRDYLRALRNEGRLVGDHARLATGFLQAVEEVTMSFAEYAKALEQNGSAYPVMLDAVEACAKDLGADREGNMTRLPKGEYGAVWGRWSDGKGYWNGFSWDLDDETWACLSVVWEYDDSAPDGALDGPEFTWLAVGPEKGWGYRAYVELEVGGRDRKRQRRQWSPSAFGKALAVDDGREIRDALMGLRKKVKAGR